jgi:hypothetical protein
MIRNTQRPREQRPAGELQRKLVAQLGFLRTSYHAYDAGNHEEAVRLATVLRVLLHDEGRWPSLLSVMGIKQAIQYKDTAVSVEIIDRARAHLNPAPVSGVMVLYPFEPRVGFVEQKGAADGSLSWVAPLRDRQLIGNQPTPPKQFDLWWTDPVIVDSAGNSFNRQNLVLIAANQDGGAHVDEELDKAFAELCRDNLGLEYVPHGAPGSELGLHAPAEAFVPAKNNVAYASIRQIAYEFIWSYRAYDVSMGASDPTGRS